MNKRNTLKTNRTSRTSRNKKLIIAAGIAVVLYLLVSFIFGEMGLIKYYRMNAQCNSLTKEIATLKQDNARLMREVHALKTDPDHLEQIARDKLGLARPGELVYYYGDP
jgi:cell division protein FtsB